MCPLQGDVSPEEDPDLLKSKQPAISRHCSQTKVILYRDRDGLAACVV